MGWVQSEWMVKLEVWQRDVQNGRKDYINSESDVCGNMEGWWWCGLVNDGVNWRCEGETT